MDINNGVKSILEEHISAHPLWRYDDDDKLYYPIYELDEVPDEPFNFFIRAKFTTPTGLSMQGYLVSITKKYCIVVFYNGKEYIFNKNLKERCKERTERLITELKTSRIKKKSDIFPLKYTTTINWPDYNELNGEFALLN